MYFSEWGLGISSIGHAKLDVVIEDHVSTGREVNKKVLIQKEDKLLPKNLESIAGIN